MDTTSRICSITKAKFWGHKEYDDFNLDESVIDEPKLEINTIKAEETQDAGPGKSPKKRRQKDEIWSCPLCLKEFSSKSNLQIHSTIHSGHRYMCASCNKGFTQKCNLKRHEATHLGVKSFICIMCKRTFTQKVNLQRHYAMHSGLKEFWCDECGKGFSQKCNLEKHLKNHFGVSKLKIVIVGDEAALSNNSDSHD